MATYIGIVHKGKKTDYGVCFPDFPGCITAGTTTQEMQEMAEEALRFHIEMILKDGELLPARPMTLAEAKKHEFANGATMFIAVEAPSLSKPIRVNVMLDSNLVERIDRFADNRSAFLAQAARNELARQNLKH